jgi:hypothetical protein
MLFHWTQEPFNQARINYGGSRYRGGPGGHRDVGRQRPEPDAVGQADGDGGGGCLHQDQDRRRNQAEVDPEAALVSVLGRPGDRMRFDRNNETERNTNCVGKPSLPLIT